MEMLNRMMECISYMEERLDSDIDIGEVAAIAYSSKFHFQRLFHMLTGVTVGEYIRRRRLTLAAQELSSSDAKVIDLALKYGYDTPESFSRAFRKIHGITPTQAREPGRSLKAFPRLSFQIQLKGDQDMNYKIVEKDAFRVLGKGIRVTTVNGENFKAIPKFWDESNQNGLCNELGEMAGPMGLLGICMEFSPDQEEFTYMIAAEKTADDVPDGFDVKEIPASTWAIFECVGPMPTAIQDTIQRIFNEWFPATGYEHADAPEIEVYLPGNPSAEDYRSEIWMPVVKK